MPSLLRLLAIGARVFGALAHERRQGASSREPWYGRRRKVVSAWKIGSSPARARHRTADKKPVPGIQGREKRLDGAARFGAADEEHAAGPEGKVKEVEDPFLRGAIKID